MTTGRHRVAWRPTGAGSNVWHVVDGITGATIARLSDRDAAQDRAQAENLRTLPDTLAREARRLGVRSC